MKTAQKVKDSPEEIAVKTVDLYIDSKLITITGDWSWQLNCDAVFCSDVMAALNQHYPGTKGIIHPDDVSNVKEGLTAIGSGDGSLDFRIITTYGEVKLLSGNNCQLTETDPLRIWDPEKITIEEVLKSRQLEQQLNWLHTLQQASARAELITHTGSWQINADTLETYFSDNVYRIHGLQPQSLNPHPHCFTAFIHPEDLVVFRETFDKAFRDKICLHIEYRIILGDDKIKFITLHTDWTHNLNGQSILTGHITDRSESIMDYTLAEEANYKLDLQRKVLQLNEKQGNTAWWYINLLTRQTYYSDNFFRLHGLKPRSVAARPSLFLNYVHPDDRELVEDAYDKIRLVHSAPDIRFRIIRSDKRTRFIEQKGQLITYANNELIMVCSIRDVTAMAMAEERNKRQEDDAMINSLIRGISEDLAESTGWMWDPATGETVWSDKIYDLLGSKKTVKEMTPELLLKAVFPQDRKLFSDEIRLATEGMGNRDFTFRILRTGEVRDMKALFKIVDHNNRKLFIGALQDITEITVLKKLLQEQVHFNNLFTENILDRIFITDADHNITLWNRKCEDFYRLKKEEVAGRNYFDLFPAHKNESSINRFNRVLKGDIVHGTAEKSSSKTFHDLHMLPLRDNQNNITGIVHVMRDVTKEVLLHNSLNERLVFIEKLLEETVDRIIVVNKTLAYTYWNRKAEQFYHINKEYAIGKNIMEVFPSFVNDPLYDGLKKALRGETVHVGSPLVSEHHEKFSESYLVPLFGDGNEVNGVLWIVHDLSKEAALAIAEKDIYEKKFHLEKINNELIQQNEIFRYAEEIGNMGTWVWNPVTNKSHFSDNMFRLFGMQPGEITPGFDTIPAFIHPEDRDRMLASAQNLREGKTSVIEYRITRRDGSVRNFRNRTRIVNYNNEKHIIGITQDITERYELEAARQSTEQLLERKDEFLRIVGHELRTPVTIIKGSMQVLLEQFDGTGAKGEVMTFLQKCIRQADKLAELLNDLLSVKVTNGEKIQLVKTRLDLSKLVMECIDEILLQYNDRPIDVSISPRLVLQADATRIRQVMNNLLTNAIKYSPVNKKIRVKMRTSGEFLKVEITDEGVGIADEEVMHVFEKYFRGGTSKVIGLGLGLYISKEIIEKHGGTMGVSSKPGKGSTFWFTLPR